MAILLSYNVALVPVVFDFGHSVWCWFRFYTSKTTASLVLGSHSLYIQMLKNGILGHLHTLALVLFF